MYFDLSSLQLATGLAFHNIRDSLLIKRTTQESSCQHATLFHPHAHTHIKVTPPAVPETPFITGDLNLFTMPYMKGAEDLLFLLLQHQLPTHRSKTSSNVSDNITITRGL